MRTQRVIVGAGEEIHRMKHVIRTPYGRPHQYENEKRAGRADRATRMDGLSPSGRPVGREGASHMEIKIIINEAGMDHTPRRGAAQRRRWGHTPDAQREHGQPRGRVIGKLVELPDGRVKVVGHRGSDGGHRGSDGGHRGSDGGHRGSDGGHRGTDGGHRGPDGGHRGMRGGRCAASRHEAGGREQAYRAERPHSPADREARHARRRLIREIVRALEAAEHNQA